MGNVLLGVLVVLAVSPEAAASDALTERTEQLSVAVHGHSAVWTGTQALVFGGESGAGNPQCAIQEHAPPTAQVAKVASCLVQQHMTSAVWNGTHAFLFGGFRVGTHLDDIVRYDPATDRAELLESTKSSCRLPTARAHTSAVFDGADAYIFGGNQGAGTQIVRFTPADCSATVLEATLPSERFGTSAVWDPRDLPAIGCGGGCAYVFGGVATNPGLDEVVRFNPASGEVKTMQAKLPKASYWHTAVWDDDTCPAGVGFAYLFGAYDGARINEVWRYEPLTDTFTVAHGTTPKALQHTAAIWDGTRALLYGGANDDGSQRAIWEYAPDPCPEALGAHATALADRLLP